MNRKYSKEELVAIFPEWKTRIENGDFGVVIDDNGTTHIQWPNTTIFRPSQSDVGHAINRLYPDRTIALDKRFFHNLFLTGIEVVFSL